MSCHLSRYQMRFWWLEVNVWSSFTGRVCNPGPYWCEQRYAWILQISNIITSRHYILHHMQLKSTMFSPFLFCWWTFKQLISPVTLVALRNYSSICSPLIFWTEMWHWLWHFQTSLGPLFSPSAFADLFKLDRHPQTNDRHLKILP